MTPPQKMTSAQVTKEQRRAKLKFVASSILHYFFMFFLMIAPFELVRRFLPPHNHILSCFLSEGLVVGPPILALFGLIIELKWAKGKRSNPDAFLNAISKAKYIRGGILLLAAPVYLFGIGAYWFATNDGLTIHRRWFAAPVTYPWNGVIKREVACYIGRHNSLHVVFVATFSDGFSLDLANTQQSDIENNFGMVVHLTRTGEDISSPRDLAACPSLYVRLLSKN